MGGRDMAVATAMEAGGVTTERALPKERTQFMYLGSVLPDVYSFFVFSFKVELYFFFDRAFKPTSCVSLIIIAGKCKVRRVFFV